MKAFFATAATAATAATIVALSLPAAGALAAEGADCRTALQALQVQEDRVVAARRGPDAVALRRALAGLQARRNDAAKACLGGRADAPPAAAIARPPVALSASPMPPPRVPVPVPVPSTTPVLPSVAAPARPSPPVFVTGCDAGGCWSSDGTRLPNTGAGVLSPQGPCSVVGSALHCPR